jgi:hypothetical protein
MTYFKAVRIILAFLSVGIALIMLIGLGFIQTMSFVATACTSVVFGLFGGAYLLYLHSNK